MSIVAAKGSVGVGRWSVRVKAALPLRDDVLVHDVVDATDMLWLWPGRGFWVEVSRGQYMLF